MKGCRWWEAMSAVLVTVLAIGGCGGSGGSDGGGDDGDSSDTVQLTAANAENVGTNALGAVMSMSEVADFGAELARILGNLPAATRTAARSAAAQVPGVCTQGTADLTLTDVAPADVISVGDLAVLTFSSCVIDDPIGPTTFDGAVTLSVTHTSSRSN